MTSGLLYKLLDNLCYLHQQSEALIYTSPCMCACASVLCVCVCVTRVCVHIRVYCMLTSCPVNCSMLLFISCHDIWEPTFKQRLKGVHSATNGTPVQRGLASHICCIEEVLCLFVDEIQTLGSQWINASCSPVKTAFPLCVTCSHINLGYETKVNKCFARGQ